MIQEADHNTALADRQWDICIVGSGVMGLALTSHLATHSKACILLLEQGPLEDTDQLSAVTAERNTGDLASGVEASRAQGFGGSSRRWGGQALPFCHLDLADRPFLPDRSPWPLTLEDLSPHYEQASTFLGLDPVPFSSDLWRNRKLHQAFGRERSLELGFSKWSPFAYLADRYRPLIAASARISCLCQARAIAVCLNREGDRAIGVRVRNGNGQEWLARAHRIVLCGGGIENPRLLLASRQGDRQGIGNGHDLVGRYYQDHIGYYAARLEPLQWGLFRHLFASFLKGNQKFLPKLQLSQQKQFSEQQLNVTGNLEIQENQNSPHQAARRLYRSLHNMHSEGANPLRDGMLLLRAPGTSLSIAKSFLRRRLYIPRQASFFLTANAESEPLHASRILLDDRCDGQGQPRALVHWCCSDRSLKALQAYLEALKETLEPAGIARIHPSDSLIHPGLNWQDRAYSLYHHMGATRMAATATQGVVDPNGQVFGVQGLYVSGTSVLPTGSASNPSFTALALTFRLGDHLLPDLPSS